MKKLKEIIKFVIPLIVITFSPLILNANAAPCCTWYAHGCENSALILPDGTGLLFTNCGDGDIYVGSGTYGGCPGVEHACEAGPVYT